MRIAILNECFLSEKHLEKLKKLGEVTFYKDTETEEETIERVNGMDVVIADCFSTPLTKNVFEKTSSIRYLTVCWTGYDGVDIESAHHKGIILSNVPDYSLDAVAEHTVGLMFAVVKKITLGDREMRKNPFQISSAQNKFNELIGFNLRGKTLGLIGLGRIGSRVAELAKGIGMNVCSFSRSPKHNSTIAQASFEDVLRQSDIVSLHIPLTPDTKEMFGKKEFNMMKTESVIINTARGGLINEGDLFEALESKQLAGAGLDTISNLDKSNPLFTLDTVVFTPHSAFFTAESVAKQGDTIVANVEAFVKGNPINLIT